MSPIHHNQNTISRVLLLVIISSIFLHAEHVSAKSASSQKSYKGRVGGQHRNVQEVRARPSKGCKYKVSKGGPVPVRQLEEVGTERQLMGVIPNQYYATEITTKVLPPVPAPVPVVTTAAAGDSFHWAYDGPVDPTVTYEICPEPSAMPSLSSKPSTRPSSKPSPRPTLSVSPSFQPTTSQQPSETKVLACSYVLAGSVYTGTKETHDTVSGSYYYEMVMSVDADVATIVGQIDSVLRDRVSPLVTNCVGSVRRVLNTEEEQRNSIDGVDLKGNDVVLAGATCTLSFDKSQICRVYQGDYDLYVRKNTLTTDQAHGYMADSIAKEMTGKDNDFLVSSISGLDRIAFIGLDAPPVDQLSASTVLTSGRDENASASLSATGISLAAIGSVLTLLFLFAASRKRESYRVQRLEEIVEDDESIFKGDQNGNTEWKGGRGAHVLGEEDSVYSGDFDSESVMNDIRVAEKRRLYGMGTKRIYTQIGPLENDLGATGDALNVHSCTSATCQICNNTGLRSPVFVSSDLLTPVSEVTCETEIITPKFSTPDTVDIDMAPRPYSSPDTIEI